MSITSHTSDFLPIIIGQRVRKRLIRGIDAVFADTGVEVFFFLQSHHISGALTKTTLSKNPRLTASISLLLSLPTLNLMPIFPTAGPASHPTPADPAVVSPINTIGSSPKLYVFRRSVSTLWSAEMPTRVVSVEVETEERRLMRRRRRRWRLRHRTRLERGRALVERVELAL